MFSRAHGEHDCGHYAAMKSNVPALEMRTGLFCFFGGKMTLVCFKQYAKWNP